MQQYIVIFQILITIGLPTSELLAICITGNCINGKGTFLYEGVGKYSGGFYQAMPHGQGSLVLQDGSNYLGEFTHGKKNGWGKMTFRTGEVYEGFFALDRIAGEGKICYSNGDTYSGGWENGRASGKGKYTFYDGDFYDGNFLKGNFDGYGKLTRKDGSYYMGEWNLSKKHGKGVAFSKGKKVVQFYDMNQLVKQIEYTELTPDKYETNEIPTKNLITTNNPSRDCNNQFCHKQKGIFKYGDGSVYEGDFLNGQGNGLGTCKYINGNIYRGGWKNHAPHGKGRMYFSSGEVYNGIWTNGVPTQIQNVDTKTNIENIKSQKPDRKTNNGETEIFALVVGVATYNHMQSLKYTDDDAYQLYAFLKSPEGGAIQDENIKILIDDAATNKNVTQEINQIASKADANDVILLYLSGHGLDGAFVPSDFDGYKNEIPYSNILDILDHSAAKHKLFITDACHSGSMLTSARAPMSISLENYYGAFSSSQGGTAVMMSSKKEEVSLEYGGLRQGIFSHFLIKGLTGNADKNTDNLITVTELYEYVAANVKSYTINAQHPVIMGDYDKNMPVAWVR